jgi:hypothetical protein
VDREECFGGVEQRLTGAVTAGSHGHRFYRDADAAI